MANYILKIGGMSCEHCKNAVAQALEALVGVADVRVDLASGTAEADINASQCGDSQLRAAIEELGFDYLGKADIP